MNGFAESNLLVALGEKINEDNQNKKTNPNGSVVKKLFGFVCSGGPEGDRTLDLRVANAALSQLSYSPKR